MPTKTAKPKSFRKMVISKRVVLKSTILILALATVYFFIKSLASQIIFA